MFLNNDAKIILLSGVNKVADFVSATMGPGGKFINIKNGNNNHITKDGVTVARFFTVHEKAEQVGVEMIIDAAKQTLYAAGDGTTTTTVIAREMMQQGYHRLQLKRLNTQLISKHLVNFSEIAIKAIREQAIKVTLGDEQGDKILKQVGTISANGDTGLADLCLQAIKQVGTDHTNITFVEAPFDDEDSITYKTGMILKSRVGGEILGPFSRRRIKGLSDEGKIAVIITKALDREVSLTRDLSDLFASLAKKGHGVLMICKEPATNLKGVIANDGERKQMAFISPSLHGSKFVQLADDVIRLTGATSLNEKRADNDPLPELFLGYCDSVEINRDGMTLIKPDREGSPEHLELIESVKGMIKEETHAVNRVMLKERLARLSSGVAVIRVTGQGGDDILERKDRYDDCVRAICTAVNTGVVRGGGAAYLSAAYQIAGIAIDPLDQERKIARDLIEAALVTPFNTITTNTLNYIPKIDGARLVKETDLTVDVWSGDFISASENGILDPLGVQEAAIKSAVKATTVFLNTGGMYNSLSQSF